VLFHLGANVDPARDVLITKGPLDALDHAPDQMGYGGKLGIDCTRKLLGEGIRRPWPERVGIPPWVLKKIQGILEEVLH
jgi:4-hydroxy-3-polyprenylbenzoate decarboxylase